MQPDITFEAIDKMITEAKSAEFKEVDELTESERLSVVVIAGVETITRLNERGNLEIRTKWPVGLIKVNGKFNIFERPRWKNH